MIDPCGSTIRFAMTSQKTTALEIQLSRWSEGRDLGTAAAPETAADGSSDFFFEPRGSQGGEEKRKTELKEFPSVVGYIYIYYIE